MDSMDDDSPMPDASEIASRNDQSRAMREVRRSMNGALISAPPALKSSDVPNGFLNFSENLTSRLGTTPQAPSFREFDHPSHDSSVFAKDVNEQPSTSSSRDSTTPSDDARGADAVAEAQLRRGLAMLRTGLCYDVRMRYHCELDPPKQRVDFHPEDPRRIFVIYNVLCKAGLVDDRDTLRDEEGAKILVPNPLMRVFARPATQAEICLVHDKKHYDFIESTKDMTEEMLVHLEKQFDSVYFNKLTFQSALLSTGGAIDTCKAVAGRQLKNAIAVIRPPGHHAECNRPMGFCMFDNVSIAAKVCQLDFVDTCRKILIIDWDVHHGNGIQQAFYQDPNVLYISIHVHENGEFYPSGPFGDHYHCGAGPGLGKNVNIPWPTRGMGDADYLYAFQQIVMPIAYDFNPDLVIIAAGFDAAAGDQLGGCFVTPTCYAHMTHMLMPLADGRLVVCLEGGYNLKSISKSALAVTRTLMGAAPDRMLQTKPTVSGAATVQKVANYQSRFWPFLNANATEASLAPAGYIRTHDVIREHQREQLYKEHKMNPLKIFRNEISQSFENQVLATPDYHQALPLIVIVHDPPEMFKRSKKKDTDLMEAHEAFLANGIKNYTDWAVKQGYSVIDINVPKFLTGIDPEDTHDDKPEEKSEDKQDEKTEEKPKRIVALNELLIYIWENYIEPNPANPVVFIGIGSAYEGIINLLNTRGKTLRRSCTFKEGQASLTPEQEAFFQRVAGIVNFVGGNPLIPVSDQNVYYLSKWYKANSLLFLPPTHGVFHLATAKKPSKRFGTLVKSEENNLGNMLVAHHEEVEEFIEQKMAVKGGKARMRRGGEKVDEGRMGV